MVVGWGIHRAAGESWTGLEWRSWRAQEAWWRPVQGWILMSMWLTMQTCMCASLDLFLSQIFRWDSILFSSVHFAEMAGNRPCRSHRAALSFPLAREHALCPVAASPLHLRLTTVAKSPKRCLVICSRQGLMSFDRRPCQVSSLVEMTSI